MDPDVVEISNLHRQFGYTEKEFGNRKVDVLEKRLKSYNPRIVQVSLDGSKETHDKIRGKNSYNEVIKAHAVSICTA